MMIAYRIACLIGGYFFGLFQTSFIYGKLHGIDIREHGSGNAGTTNALRTLGPKAGIIVLLGDFLKCFIACMIARVIFAKLAPDAELLMMLYTGFGVGLGHIFPFYMGFKGGKGIAVSAGIIVALLKPWIVLACALLFFGLLAITRYVSLCSIVLMFGMIAFYCIELFQNVFPIAPQYYVESIIVLSVYAAMAIYMHRANIGRLLRHEENQFSLHKSEK